MSRFIRFLSRRRTGRGIRRSGTDQADSAAVGKKGHLLCKVELLDGTDINVDLPVRKPLNVSIIVILFTLRFILFLVFSCCDCFKVSYSSGSPIYLYVDGSEVWNPYIHV